MSFWDTLGSVAQGLIEIGPVKIDNDTVEKIVGAGAVLIAGYAAYKVLNDKGSAENVAMLAWRLTAALTMAPASAAPLPSPRRMPRSRSGSALSFCSRRRCAGSAERCANRQWSSALGLAACRIAAEAEAT